MKVLGLFQDFDRPDLAEMLEKERNDFIPRSSVFHTELNADILDRKMLERAPMLRRLLYARLPLPMAQAIEAFIIQDEYDVILSWQERAGFPFALLCKLLRKTSVPHVALCSWPSKGVKGFLLRFVHTHIDRLILWSTVQRRIVVEEMDIPAEKISFIHYFVDDKFYRPTNTRTDTICSVGSEMRDYPTLIEALRGVSIPCHVAAGTLNRRRSRWVRKIDRRTDLPANMSVGVLGAGELRDLYARSRFLVITLHESNTDNGITCILEAMAMGRPVICSRTEGQVDVIKHGETGILVPVGDSVALRSAVRELWNDPARAERMGKAARRYVEEFQSLDKFITDVKLIVLDVLKKRNAERSTNGEARECCEVETLPQVQNHEM